MKNANLESKTISMPVKTRGIASLQVRSGVKAGRGGMHATGMHVGDGMHGGGHGRGGGGLDRQL